MTPELFQKWLDITKALAADPSAVIRCPQCEKADLEIQDAPAPGYEGITDRHACCSACGVKVAVPKPRSSAAKAEAERNGRWVELRGRLLALGWTIETVEVEDGLRSPHNAMVTIAEEVVEDARRAMLLKSLRMQCSTLRARIARNADRDIERQKDVLGDFEQLIQCLVALGLG